MLRFDLYFSYWIFVWFIVSIIFMFSVVPFYSLCLVLAYHICVFMYSIYYNKYRLDKSFIIGNIIVILFIKLFPIIYIINNVSKRVRFEEELKIFLVLIVIYVIWKYVVNEISIEEEYKLFKKNGLSKNTPLVEIVKTIFSFF